MVQVDFDQVDDAENFVSVPNGSYVCSVGEVRARRGDDGAERWGVRWIVSEGPYAGRTAAWDSLVFTVRGLRRAKLVLGRIGIPVEGEQRLEPLALEGRRARVTVYARERVDSVTGRRVISNRVPYAGVEALGPGENATPEDDDTHGAPGTAPLSGEDEGLEDDVF